MDNESRRTFVEKERSVVAGTSAEPGVLASWLFLGDSIAQPLPGRVSPHTYGGDILFRTQVTLYAELPAGPADTSAVDVEYTFAPPESHEESEPAHNGVLKGLQPVAGIILQPPGGEDSTSYEISSGHARPAVSLFVPLPTQRLPLRPFTFSMTLRQGSRTFTLSRPVRMVWPEMPLSLRNVDFALDALRFLASESQLDSLRDGDFDTRVRNLERFWDARDLRPETPTNEAMVQYYRRVDHAVTTFATLRQPDGLRSDRARIYVLYGPPTRTERSLDPQSGFREIWIYERLNRRFTFVDRTRSGTYTLESTSP